MTLVQSLATQGLTVVVALHDLNLTARYAHRVAVLDQGELAGIGAPQETLTEALIERVWQLPVRLLNVFDQMIISA
jgi:iron complex transport system ATP-binding protein